MTRTRKAGFTLIELLVVVAIISLLIGILLPTLGKVREKGKSVQCLSNLRQIGIAACIYVQENNWCFPFSSPQNSTDTRDWIAWQPARINQIGTIGVGPYMRLSPTNYKAMICPSDFVTTNHPNYPFSYVQNWYIAGNSNADPSVEIAREQKTVRFPGECIWYYEEAASTIDDGNGSIMQPPNAFNWLNLLSSVHDASNARSPEGKAGSVPSPLPNPKAKGNVSFVDGHAETVTRRYAHSTKHTFPKPSIASQADP